MGFSVAKYAEKSEYGLFVIMISIIQILGNYQIAMINTPLTVFAPQKESEEKGSFISGLWFGQWLILFPIIALVMIIVSIYTFIQNDFLMIKTVLVLSIVTMTFMMREFIRTVYYSKFQIQLIIKIDILFVLLITLGIGMLIGLQKVTSSYSIATLGIGYFFSAILGRYYTKERYNFRWGDIKNAFSETWKYSRWALAGVTSDIFKNRGYIYIVSLMLGLGEIADISVARLFLMPVGLIADSSGKIMLAKGAELLSARDNVRFKKFFISVSYFLSFAWLIYIIILYFFYDYIISILGNKYKNNQGILILWSFYFLIYILRYTITNALTVYKEFKALANYSMVSAIITIATCLFLVLFVGGYGAIISLIAGELILAVLAAARMIMVLRPK